MKNNNFPLHIFPKVITDYFKELEENNGFDVGYMGGAYLSVLSTIVGTSIELVVNDSWKFHPTIWMALVGDSGSKKTPSVKPITKPLKIIDDRKYKQYLKQKEVDQEVSKDKITKPKQITMNDTTYEALTTSLESNPSGVILHLDELRTLFDESSQLGKHLTKLLSIYNSEPITINRKTNGEFLKINKPFMSILGGIQTKLFGDFLKGGRLDSGFVYRFLFVKQGDVKQIGSLDNIDETIKENYENFLAKAISLNKTEESKTKITLTKEALDRFKKWRISNDRTVVESSNDIEEGYLSKIEAYIIKFSFLIELTDCIQNDITIQNISDCSVEKAIDMSNYFVGNFTSLINSYNLKKEKENEEKQKRKKCVEKAISKLNPKQKEEICKELTIEGLLNKDIKNSLFISKGLVSKYVNR
jgi:hypothetical protein